ncbi:hypothetical protein FEF09_28870 [Chitinophaga pinensis]|uniref:Uncharacterized protein n=2 Tax=Chitinophaga pinensis TaxID=79329 RepID=A0A5C6LJH7_9BACT|nr:hypothetical protein FEF09_28870 [Chitinophaga pinensis]
METKDRPLYGHGVVRQQLFNRYYDKSLQAYPAAVLAKDINELERLFAAKMPDQDCLFMKGV